MVLGWGIDPPMPTWPDLMAAVIALREKSGIFWANQASRRVPPSPALTLNLNFFTFGISETYKNCYNTGTNHNIG